ncbi:uncharacterized protein LOC132042310 [Lycium ferocissimum]|uniref:uncharacterized protein LOC132042310 n=1 Tax=Lycium ferocissimum TaxID=112874 RepID=UPI0028154931|nr:uncharacterized protein LOC132042310 [Lycium ferocissimum]
MVPPNELLCLQQGSEKSIASVFWEVVSDPISAGDCRVTEMKRTVSDDKDGGAKKAPRMSPGPSRRSPSYSIETDPSEDPTEDSYDTDPSEDPATIPPEMLTPRAEDSAEGGYETDPSEDPVATPPESATPSEEDPSEYEAEAPGEELPDIVPAAPMMEHYVPPSSSQGSEKSIASVFWEVVSDPISAGDCRVTGMKRTVSDDKDGGAKKAPRMSPGPSRRSPSYSIETDPSEDPTEDSYDTDPSEDPATIPPEMLTPRAEDSAEGGYETDPSEDPVATPPESATPSEEDPSEYEAEAPGEELPDIVPAAPMMEHYVPPASSVSVTSYSSPLSWSSVNQESSDYLYSSDSDEEDSEEEYPSLYSSLDRGR